MTELAIFALAFFSRKLGPSPMGVFFLFQALVGITTVFVDLGLGTAVEKRISEGTRSGDFLSTSLAMKTVLLTVVVGAIVLVRGPINTYVGADVALLLAAAIVASDLGTLMTNVLRGELRVGATAVLDLTRLVLWAGLGAVFISVGLSTYALVYAFVIGLVGRLLFGIYRRSTPLGRPSRTNARSLYDYGRYDVISGLGWHAFSWLDVLVVGWFLSQAAVGVYEVAWRVAGITTLLSTAIATTVLPQVSAWDADNATDRIENLLYSALTPSLVLIIPSILGIALLAREVLGLLFGPEFTRAWLVLIVLTSGKVFSAVQSLVGRCLLGIDRPDLVARATAVAVVLNVVLNVVLVQQAGILGAAVATTGSYAVGTVMRTRYLSRFLRIRFPYREVGWCVLATVVMAVAIQAIEAAFVIDTVPRLLAVIAFGAVVYGGVVLLSSQLRERIVANARNILA
jgi:O-antigen/teichoic acid export membrane protein